MKQYLELLDNIIHNGVEKESGRENMPNTIGISKADISMNMSDGFPLLTTKKMYFKGIFHELIWFLGGETNIRYLVDNNVNIWNGDAYRWYLKTCKDNNIDVYYHTIEEFVNAIINNIIEFGDKDYNDDFFKHLNQLHDVGYFLGDLGKVYGYQWRNQNGVDQVQEVLNGLKSNPYSRYHIIDGWNKADFSEMALPPCHLLYQFIVRPLSLEERRNLVPDSTPNLLTHIDFDCINIPKFYLDLNMYQRSVDTALGCPYNIASMSLLLILFAKASNMVTGVANWVGGDTHLYVTHINAAKEQLDREPYKLPKLEILKEINNLDDILSLSLDDVKIIDYKSHPTIKFELFTGLKK